jgi:predicted membrane protein
MDQDQNNFKQYDSGRGSRIWAGLILLSAGVLLLIYKMGGPVPGWLFTWPVLLIVIGLALGAKSRFHNPGSFILIIIGTIFLVEQMNPMWDFHRYILPLILIAVGMVYILRPRHTFGRHYRGRSRGGRWNYVDDPRFSKPDISNQASTTGENDDAEYVEINAVFSGVKKNILSKNFRGGAITSFMGGTELNLLKADIQGSVVLEVNNIFGGTKLVLPSNWDVRNEVTAVFGGIEDKRVINGTTPDPNKALILTGTCVFGGIEITYY